MVATVPSAGIGAAIWVMTAIATATGAVDLSLVDVLLVLAPLVLGRSDSWWPLDRTAAGRRGCG